MPFLAPVVGALFSGGFLTNLLVGTALSVGATLLSNALKPPQQAQISRDPGVSLSLQVGGNSPLSFIVGLSATAGHRVYAGSWGHDGETPNAFFADVLEIANAPVDGLNGVFVEKERATILVGEEHPEYGFPILQGRRGGQDYLWIKFHDGRQVAPDAYLRSRFGAHPSRPYDADMVGLGTSYAVVTTRYNRENWNGRPPSMLFEVRGLRCYDIRKDSTAGGSGAHRRNNPATWEWSKNPYVIAYNTAFMGVFVGTEWLWGLQNLPLLRLPQSAWIAAMNECDRSLSGWAGAQFEIGGEITVDMQPATVLDEIAKASLGKFIESAGSYKPRCGLPGASIWSFGEGQLLITDPRTFTPFPGLEATHNTVEISYSEPLEGWGAKPAPEATDAAMITADGNRKLSAGLDLGLVNRNEQAQRLGWSYLRDGRRFRTFRGSFHPISWALEPGDVIDGTILAEGYDGKAFEIIEMSGRRTFVQTMTIREVDPEDFDPPESAYQDWSVGPIQTLYPPSQPATGISFAPYELLDNENRSRRPGIEGFYQGGMDDVRYFAVQVRRPGDTLPFFEGEFPYRADVVGEASQPIFSQSFVPNMDVEVRGKYVPFTSRETSWGTWMAVRLPDVKLGPLDVVYGDIDLDELGEQVDGFFDWMGMGLRDLFEQSQALALLAGDQELANALQFDEMRRSLSLVANDLSASFEETITVAIVPMQGQLVAMADALTELSAADEGDISTARIRFTTVTGPSGYSRVGIETRFDPADGGDFRLAGSYWDTPNDPDLKTRRLEIAEQYVIAESPASAAFQPFIFESGNLRVANAIVGSASIVDAAITTAKIADAAIESAKIADAAITTAKIGDAQIATAKIGLAQIDTLRIAGGAVTATTSDAPADGPVSSGSPKSATIAIPGVLSGGVVQVQAYADIPTGGGASGGIYTFSLYRNGSLIRQQSFGASSVARYVFQHIAADVVPSAGTITYVATLSSNFASPDTVTGMVLVGSYAKR